MSAYLRTEAALELVRDERRRQDGLKAAGRFAFTCADLAPDLMKLPILAEEVGEVSRLLCEAFQHELDEKRLREELVQVAAVALAWIEALEPAPLSKPTRVWIDGLVWCAECTRAVDRGWSHEKGCSLA